LQFRRVKNDLKLFSTYCDKIVVISEWYKNIILENGVPESKIEFIPTILVKSTKEDKKLEKLPLRLVYVGRISEHKGIGTMVSAVSKINPLNVQLDIYGPKSEYLEHILELIQDKSNINYKGFVSNQEISNFVKDYCAMVLPSEMTEMSPLSIVEAIQNNLVPIVSSSKGNVMYINNNENGFVFKVGESQALLNIVEDMVDMIKNNKTVLTERLEIIDYGYNSYIDLFQRL